MRTTFLLGAAACSLAFLIGCSTPSPSPSSSPAKHPTSCNKDPKKEPHFHDCNGNIYLPGHMPEECIPEEPEVVLQKPDPIIGTYHIFYTTVPERQNILRIYSTNRASLGYGKDIYRWEREEDAYHFYVNVPGKPESYKYSSEYTDLAGEPHLKTFGSNSGWGYFEAVKLSGDPDYLFDHFRLTWLKGNIWKWGCVNIGRKQETNGTLPYKRSWTHSQIDFADSLEECEALCPEAVQKDPKWGAKRSCPEDRR